MKRKKIAFYGLFGQKNIGNDCTFQAILHNIRERIPNADILCICSGPDEIFHQHNIQTYPIRGIENISSSKINNPILRVLRKIFIQLPIELYIWFKAFFILKGADMLVVPGTGLLVDFSTTPFGFPYHVFGWSVIARLCKCKLLFVSVGAGPINHSLSRWFIKAALSLAHYRSYRDNFSKQYIERIGFKRSEDRVYPDLAFSLPTSVFPDNSDQIPHSYDIGVGILDYYGIGSVRQRTEPNTIYQDFIDKLFCFGKYLINNNYTMRILIGDIRYDSGVRQDLLKRFKSRRGNYELKNIISEPISNIDQLLLQIVKTDIVISPRFHNIILALMLNKPVISISYNEKFDSLMKEFGLIEYCQPIEYLNTKILIEQFEDIISNRKNIIHRISNKTKEYRQALNEQYDIIFSTIFVK